MKIGANDYRRGGLERLSEAGLLLRNQSFAGAVYLSGRAVEGMLRAVIWKNDLGYFSGKKSLETGHDLRELLTLVENLGILGNDEHRHELAGNVQMIGRLWFNNMRFLPSFKLEDHWKNAGMVSRKRTMKQAVAYYYDGCSAIVKRCEALCQN